MEWSVSDDVDDDVMALPGPAIVGPLLFLQGEILFSKKILQKLHRHDTHTADREELLPCHGHEVSKSAYARITERYQNACRNVKIGQRCREQHFHVQLVFLVLVER